MSSAIAAFRALDDGRHRSELYRMWASGHRAGLTHPAILETMGPRESAPTEAIRSWMLEGTRGGESVADRVAAGGDRFEDFERSLLVFGDEAGQLDQALPLLGDFYARKHRLMLHVKKELVYPMVTGLAACFVAPLPILVVLGNPTIYLATALTGVAWILLGGGALIATVAARYGRRPAMARARLARALATGIQAGLPLPRAIRLAADASAHPAIIAHVRRATDRQLATTSSSDSLAGCPHLTPELLAVIGTAEETGDFQPLVRLAELYEDGFR